MNKYIEEKQTVILEEEEPSGDETERQITDRKISSFTPTEPKIIAEDLKFTPPLSQSDSGTESPKKEFVSPHQLRKAGRGKGIKRSANKRNKPEEPKTFFDKIRWEIQHVEWDKEREAKDPKLFRVPRKTTNTEFTRSLLQEFKDWCISNLDLNMKADQTYLQWVINNMNDQAAIITQLSSNSVRSTTKLTLTPQLTSLLLDEKHLYHQKIISKGQIPPSDPDWEARIEEKISQFFNLTKFEFIISELEELVLQMDKAIFDSVQVDPVVNSRGQPISNRDHYGIK